MRSTVLIPQDKRHRHLITVPVEIWNGEGLHEGDLIEIHWSSVKEFYSMKSRIKDCRITRF